MQVKNIIAVALCAQSGIAVPHRANHQGFHLKRAITTSYATVTDIVTVTDYNAVVWVDYAGRVIKTESMTSNAVTSTTSSAAPVTSGNTVETTTSMGSTTSSAPTTTAAAEKLDPATSISSSAASTYSYTSSSTVTTAASVLAKVIPSPEVSSAPYSVTSPSVSAVTSQGSTGAGPAGTVPGFGIAYDAWAGSGCRPTLDSEFSFMASQGASKIRVYDVCFTESVNAAAAHNLKLMIGITSFDNFDTSFNQLISDVTATQPGWSVIDTVFIGNELVNDGLATSQAVADKVSYARGILKTKGYTGSVVTVDTWTKMRDDPVICSTSDYCAANAHAFFDGNVLPADAGGFVRKAYDAVAAANAGKHVVISESGWPHAGAPQGVSVASVDAQRTAMRSIVTEFAGDAADMFLFMGYDATYKTNQPEVERNFGIFDSSHYNGTP